MYFASIVLGNPVSIMGVKVNKITCQIILIINYSYCKD